MLKLKVGQVVKKKTSTTNYYVADVTENSVMINSSKDFMNDVYWYPNVKYLYYFNYTEPFEPKEGECVYFLTGSVPQVTSGAYEIGAQYLFNRVFRTLEEATEFLYKVNAIS